eukprot:jgi/Mesen1/2529/ME000161S01582
MEDGDAQWEELRREARKVEGDIDVKLSSYAKLGGMLSHGGYVEPGSGGDALGGDGSWKSVEMEIEALLEKLLDINDGMSRCVAGTTSASSVTQKLARHRDILHEFTQEFRRTRCNITSAREHAELLTSVRNDISEFKASAVTPSHLTERRAIHGNISQMDDLIGHATATRATLMTQRGLFESVKGRMKTLRDKFPAVRNVLGAIRRKRSRDTLILTAVIIGCTLFLLVYWLSK